MDFTEGDVEKEKYGDKLQYDPTGPFQKTRVRTDFCWLVGFIFYLVVWCIVIIYAFSKGSVEKWRAPRDFMGRSCGADELVYDKPYLVSYNQYSCQSFECKACVHQCPDKEFLYDSSSNDSSIEDIKKLMLCQPDVKLDAVTTWKELDYLVDKEKCARQYSKKVPLNMMCDLPADAEITELDDEWRTFLPKGNDILDSTKYSIIGFIVLSGFISVLSIFLMRWYAMGFVCVSIFALCAVVFHSIYDACVSNAESKTNGVLLALFICVVVLGLIVLAAIYFRRQIYLACQMISESSKAITSILSSLLLPFAIIILYFLILALGLSVSLFLMTIESPIYRADFVEMESCHCQPELYFSQNSTCDSESFAAGCAMRDGKPCVLSGCYMVDKQKQSVGFLHFINLMGLFWSYFFVMGFGDMVLASAFATWYWTFNKKILSYLTVVESFWRVTIYHLGTIALGSLIITVCAIIRFILRKTFKALEKVSKPLAALAIMNLKCVFDVMENFLDFINRRAYITCAVHGTDFISSARMAYYLIMRNVGKVVVVSEITSILMFILIILITAITTRIASIYYASRADELMFVSIPIGLVLIGSLFVTWLLIRVVGIAVDTTFLCFLEDSERNDGSYEKPYFMSEELTKFLSKK